ncbi:hypothetical protein JTB14_000443 [Gonioctena quinquepunctata]|nr:hypothetical protein JTB14_000443 [Gonioctena quinquepunctata]
MINIYRLLNENSLRITISRDTKNYQKLIRQHLSHVQIKLSEKELKEPLIGYVDADWAEDSLGKKFNSGYIFKMNGDTISWASRKQKKRVRNILRNLLEDLGKKQLKSTTFHEDNRSCLEMIRKGPYSNQTNMDIKYCFPKDLEDRSVLGYTHCPTENMIADSLTEPLQATRLKKLRILIGLVDHH